VKQKSKSQTVSVSYERQVYKLKYSQINKNLLETKWWHTYQEAWLAAESHRRHASCDHEQPGTPATVWTSFLQRPSVTHSTRRAVHCAVELGPIVAKLVNFSLTQCRVPLVWKTAHITPVPKTSPVTGAGDLRPISVTSILSCTVEKVVVRNYLTPLLRSSSFYDQYAYKPIGSTTCALADITYRIHTLLESNQYVRCVLIDFSKAFDTVDHVILARKLFHLETPVL